MANLKALSRHIFKSPCDISHLDQPHFTIYSTF